MAPARRPWSPARRSQRGRPRNCRLKSQAQGELRPPGQTRGQIHSPAAGRTHNHRATARWQRVQATAGRPCGAQRRWPGESGWANRDGDGCPGRSASCRGWHTASADNTKSSVGCGAVCDAVTREHPVRGASLTPARRTAHLAIEAGEAFENAGYGQVVLIEQARGGGGAEELRRF